jgi:hypothetical protein
MIGQPILGLPRLHDYASGGRAERDLDRATRNSGARFIG